MKYVLRMQRQHINRMMAHKKKKEQPKKYMTHADRIRSMTDEELANYLFEIGWDCHLCAEHERLENEPLLRTEKCDEKCVKHCLDWLQQPAEVE